MHEEIYRWLGIGRSSRNLRKYKYIFLLSHMRSYSTLLAHIIGSSEEVCGYVENHQSYIRDFHLAKLRYKLHLLHGSSSLPPFLLDKILHNDYHINADFLQHPNVFSIILIREPLQTVKSIMHLGTEKTTSPSWYKNPQAVSKYYIKRLKRLEKYSRMAGRKSLFVQSEDLKLHSQNILQQLTQYIQLSSPLQNEYDTFNFTGTNVLGDPGSKIKSGKIITEETNYDHITLPSDLEKKLLHKHQSSLARIGMYSNTVTI